MTAAEIMAWLETTPQRTREIVAGLKDDDLVVHPRGAQWSIHGHHVEWSMLQHVCHLRDLEVEAYAWRIDRFRDGDTPFFSDFDGDEAAELRDYDRQSFEPALEQFERARAGSVTAARAKIEAAARLQATMEGMGTITLERLLQMMRDHDAGHLTAMQKLRGHLRQRNA